MGYSNIPTSVRKKNIYIKVPIKKLFKTNRYTHRQPIHQPTGFLNLSGWWYTYPSEKYEFVSWDLFIPIWKVIKFISTNMSSSVGIFLFPYGKSKKSSPPIWVHQLGSVYSRMESHKIHLHQYEFVSWCQLGSVYSHMESHKIHLHQYEFVSWDLFIPIWKVIKFISTNMSSSVGICLFPYMESHKFHGSKLVPNHHPAMYPFTTFSMLEYEPKVHEIQRIGWQNSGSSPVVFLCYGTSQL